ncbi:MAG: response regulator transcription factor [Flavobacteriales bacterium]
MSKTRIAIYEDQSALRNSLVELIESESQFEVAVAHGNCKKVIEDIATKQLDFVILDIDLPGLDGLKALEMIRKENNEVKILLLTVFEDQQKIKRALSLGANGYLVKRDCADFLIHSILTIKNGGAAFSPVALNNLFQVSNSVAPTFQLEERELVILKMLCQGQSYKMIASNTGYTYETVRSYMKMLYSKMEVHSATEAVNKAYSLGLI